MALQHDPSTPKSAEEKSVTFPERFVRVSR
jgi:hypothetical protein